MTTKPRQADVGANLLILLEPVSQQNWLQKPWGIDLLEIARLRDSWEDHPRRVSFRPDVSSEPAPVPF